jgi:NADPH:quinone reductase-like Zn-dependent oxidoreductase
LINGAAGGVGTFAVQIAKSFGADVTGVCSTRNVEMVRSIGASHVVDYTREDFTAGAERYDLILDCVGNHSPSALRRVLAPDGVSISVGTQKKRWVIGLLAHVIKPLALSLFVSQRFVILMAKLNSEDLNVLRGLMEAWKVTPVVDRQYKLSEAAEAVRYLEAGHARGKVVITLEPDDKL